MTDPEIHDIGILDTEWAELLALKAGGQFQQFLHFYGCPTKSYRLAVLMVKEDYAAFMEINQMGVGPCQVMSSYLGRLCLEQRLLGKTNKLQFQRTLKELMYLWKD